MNLLRGICGLAGGAAVFAFASSARAECTADNDCKGDRICVEGKCENPTEETAPKGVSSEPEKVRRSDGLFVGGLVVTITGSLALSTGIVLLVLGPSDKNGGLFFAGAVVGGTGVLALPAGIPMIVIGGEKVAPQKPVAFDVAPWVSADGGGMALKTTWW